MIIGSSYELSDHYFSYLGFNFAYLSLEWEVFPDVISRKPNPPDGPLETFFFFDSIIVRLGVHDPMWHLYITCLSASPSLIKLVPPHI